ncbi:TPA: ANR family transcriptional regulator [Escherichia coli]
MNQDKAIYLENKYFSPANEAVRLEREGDYIGAWKKWNDALHYAKGENIGWCIARAEYCKKGLYAGNAEISGRHKFYARQPVRKTAVNRTAKK